MTWLSTGPFRVYDRQEELAVVYCLDSGETHLISEAAMSILETLAESAKPLDELCSALGIAQSDSEQYSVVEALLNDLAQAGLVVPQ